jgi:hypothetical protein
MFYWTPEVNRRYGWFFLGTGRLFFRSEAPGLVFSDNLSTGEFCPLRIPFDKPFDFTQGHESFDPELTTEGLEAEWLRAAVSPMDKL